MKAPEDHVTRDRLLIEQLGGPAKVAELLGLRRDGGVQRVHNWRSRGIPAAVKLSRPDLFLGNTGTSLGEAAASHQPMPGDLQHAQPRAA